MRVRNAGALWQFGSDAGIPFGLAWSGTSIDGATTATSVWDNPGSGSWTDPAHWTRNAVPSAVGAEAILPAVNTAAGTVTLTGTTVLGRLRVDSLSPYRLVGGLLRLESTSVPGPRVEVTLGSHLVAAPVELMAATTLDVAGGGTLALTGGLMGAGSLAKTGTGTLSLGGSLGYTGSTTVGGGVVRVMSSLRTANAELAVSGAMVSFLAEPSLLTSATHTVVGEFASVRVSDSGIVSLAPADNNTMKPSLLITGGLVLNEGGTLDLANHDLLVRGGNVRAIRDYVRDARLVASVAGTGTASGRDAYATLAVFPNTTEEGLPVYASFSGVAVTAADVLLKYTYVGDTDLDGILDDQDLVNLLEGLSNGFSGWQHGDFNYDGAIDPSDWAMFARAYSFYQTSGVPFAGSGTDPSVVPEPAGVAVPMIACFIALRRRCQA